MSSKYSSSKKMILRWADDENADKIITNMATKKTKIEDINRLIERSNKEYLKYASDNIKNAIQLRKNKDQKGDFYRQLIVLNDKIKIYKDLQLKEQKAEDEKEVQEEATHRHKHHSTSMVNNFANFLSLFNLGVHSSSSRIPK